MDSRTKKTNNKRFVRYSEGAEMYSMSVSKFMQLAKDAKACYKVNQLVLVNLDIIDEYLETFHIVDDEFYVKLDIENPIIRINTAFKGCSSLEKISVLPRIYHN